MSNDNLPRNRVLKLSYNEVTRDDQIKSLEKEGYFLKQISAYGTHSTSGCYGWFQRKTVRNKKIV